MKAFVAVFALAAAAAAESNVFLGHPFMTGLPLTTYMNSHLAVKPIELKAEEKKIVSPVVYNTLPFTGLYNGFPYVYNNLPYMTLKAEEKKMEMKEMEMEKAVKVEKREADPAMFYGINSWTNTWANTWANNWASPLTYNALHMPYMAHPVVMPTTVKTLANDRKATIPEHAAKDKYVAETAGSIHIAKREAEADPLFMTYGMGINSWATPATWSTYGAPLAYNWGFPLVSKMVADDRMKASPEYAMKGKYYAESAGTVHIAKREADPLTIVNAAPLAATTYASPLISSFAGLRSPYMFNTMPYMYNNWAAKAFYL